MAIYSFRNPSLASTLGSSLGTGLGSGIQSLAENKLNQLAQRNRTNDLSRTLEQLGLSPSESTFVAQLPAHQQLQGVFSLLGAKQEQQQSPDQQMNNLYQPEQGQQQQQLQQFGSQFNPEYQFPQSQLLNNPLGNVFGDNSVQSAQQQVPQPVEEPRIEQRQIKKQPNVPSDIKKQTKTQKISEDKDTKALKVFRHKLEQYRNIVKEGDLSNPSTLAVLDYAKEYGPDFSRSVLTKNTQRLMKLSSDLAVHGAKGLGARANQFLEQKIANSLPSPSQPVDVQLANIDDILKGIDLSLEDSSPERVQNEQGQEQYQDNYEFAHPEEWEPGSVIEVGGRNYKQVNNRWVVA